MNFFYEKTSTAISAQQRETRTGYYPHFHFQIELVMVLEGQLWVKVDGKEAILEQGQMCVSFPYQVHDYRDIGENRTVVMVFSPAEFKEFDAIYTSKLPLSPVVNDSEGQLRELSVQLADVMKKRPPYYDVIARGYGLILLGRVMTKLQLSDVNYAELPTLKRILHYCDEHYTEDLSLDRLSKELYISKHYISRLLNDKLGMSFTDYLNILRVQDACEKMSGSERNISQIAFRCGFTSIRSFNRNFLRITGKTPSAYLQKLHPEWKKSKAELQEEESN